MTESKSETISRTKTSILSDLEAAVSHHAAEAKRQVRLRDEAIAELYRAGASYRQIGKVAEMNHSNVAKILERDGVYR